MDEIIEEINQLGRGNAENLASPSPIDSTQVLVRMADKPTRISGKATKCKGKKENTSDWEFSKSTIRERNEKMFNNELLSDIHFIVGPLGASKRIPAHKYVLAIGSSVFFAMFNGDLAENKEEIHIPDVEPKAFLALLRYLYCDEVCLEADTVLATLYASKKYIVPYLAHACVEFLETSLSFRNACVLLSQSCLFEDEDLTQRCWEVIDAQTELSLNAEGFTDVDGKTLRSIVCRESLSVNETAVFDAANRWAEAECIRNNVEPTGKNKREALKDSLFLLRIPTMSLQEFADGPATSDLLTKEEIIKIFVWYSATTKPELTFPTEHRRGLTPHCCHRFQSTAYRSNQWRYRGRCDSIRFMADKRVFIAGYGLYGSSTGAANYKAHIKLSQNGKVLSEETAGFFSDGCSKTFSVWFKHSVQCEPGIFYTASAILDGNELSYFGQEGLSEVVCDGITIQFQCSSDSTNGTGVQGGQIPELIFYYANT
ncbi:BTB/POZ domain-containing protein 6-B [Ciona intestinalis]